MIARLFEHRSGRIIALCRMVLALVFFIALWIDPAQPVRSSELGYAMLGSYLLFATVLMGIAWNNWWWDHRLAWPSLVVDVAAFLGAVYFTEGMVDDFTSPFMAFFAYIMLAATIRWDWRMTALTGLCVIVLYLGVGVGLTALEIEFDYFRFGRRLIYMAVLALVLMWFGLQRSEQHVGRFADSPEAFGGPLPPLDEALAFAIKQTGASAGIIAWGELEEPELVVRTSGIAAAKDRLGPTELTTDTAFGNRARLFSADRSRSLRATRRRRPVSVLRTTAEPLADWSRIGEALALPFAGASGRGEVLLVGIGGVCTDHVEMGESVAREIGAGFDRHSALVLAREGALTRTRDALARDLHDSVAQSLAGAALRLEGLRKWIRADNDPDPEILQLKEALRAEQTQVRGMIERLRDNAISSGQTDLAASVGALLTSLAASWHVAIDYLPPSPVFASSAMGHEIANLLREAVANAVRHGGGAHIAVMLDRGADSLAITVADDGGGFPPGTGPDAPRSIRERVARLGGNLEVDTGPAGTRLTVGLPLGDAM